MAVVDTASGAVVVTGGAGGVGRAIAAAVVAHRPVVVADLDGDAADRVARELGPRARAARLDVSDAEACRALAVDVDAAEGLAAWVNNAGILVTGPSWEQDDATARRLFDVNTHGVINGTRAALEVFRPAGRGHVVNIVSLAGLYAPPGETLYAATKHAALGYSVGTLNDLRAAGYRDVHVSAVCPDGVWTPMLYDRVEDPGAAPSWSGTMLQPEQVAEVVVDLLRRPRPVRSIPRWRGGQARAAATFAGAALRVVPLLLAQARRRQEAWAQRHRR